MTEAETELEARVNQLVSAYKSAGGAQDIDIKRYTSLQSILDIELPAPLSLPDTNADEQLMQLRTDKAKALSTLNQIFTEAPVNTPSSTTATGDQS